MSRLHREGRVVRLASDSILEVNRTIAGHSEGLGGAVEEREERGGERGDARKPVGVHRGKQTMCGVAHLLPRAVQGKVICLGTLQALAMGKPCRGTISSSLLAAVKEEAVMVVASLLGGKGDLDIQVQTRVEATLGAGGGAHHTDQWEEGIRTGRMTEWLTFFK